MASNFSFTFDLAINEVLICFMSPPPCFVAAAFCVANIVLLVPLCTAVLRHEVQHRKKGSSSCSSSSSASTSHLHCFTHHMAVMELVGVVGCASCLVGIAAQDVDVLLVGILVFAFTWFGQVWFHGLTCAERYLAVVHPVTYLRLRSDAGIRTRTAVVGCVWLLCAAGSGLLLLDLIVVIMDVVLLTLVLMVTFFCSVSVLLVLVRPGPGEQVAKRQSKQKVFYTVASILAVLVLRFGWNLIWVGVFLSGRGGECMLGVVQMFCGLFCSLVLPLLFLHSKGELLRCGRKIR
ncbi:unnamed protein product [Ophioblennius macclurei]